MGKLLAKLVAWVFFWGFIALLMFWGILAGVTIVNSVLNALAGRGGR